MELRLNGTTIIATLNVVTTDILAPDEAGLSEAAWRLLKAQPGGGVSCDIAINVHTSLGSFGPGVAYRPKSTWDSPNTLVGYGSLQPSAADGLVAGPAPRVEWRALC